MVKEAKHPAGMGAVSWERTGRVVSLQTAQACPSKLVPSVKLYFKSFHNLLKWCHHTGQRFKYVILRETSLMKTPQWVECRTRGLHVASQGGSTCSDSGSVGQASALE